MLQQFSNIDHTKEIEREIDETSSHTGVTDTIYFCLDRVLLRNGTLHKRHVP